MTRAYVIKAAVADVAAKTFSFAAQKTMYGGKAIAAGDTLYLFASETHGGPGLIAKAVVTAVDYSGVEKPRGVTRYTPRISIEARRTATAKRPLGRAQLRPTSARVEAKANSPTASPNRPPTRSLA